jgi:hypothetical protein
VHPTVARSRTGEARWVYLEIEFSGTKATGNLEEGEA